MYLLLIVDMRAGDCRHADDCVHGRSYVMAHVREEFAFRFACFERFDPCRFELFHCIVVKSHIYDEQHYEERDDNRNGKDNHCRPLRAERGDHAVKLAVFHFGYQKPLGVGKLFAVEVKAFILPRAGTLQVHDIGVNFVVAHRIVKRGNQPLYVFGFAVLDFKMLVIGVARAVAYYEPAVFIDYVGGEGDAFLVAVVGRVDIEHINQILVGNARDKRLAFLAARLALGHCVLFGGYAYNDSAV